VEKAEMNQFITRNSGAIARIWADVARRYNVTEAEFAERIAAIADRAMAKSGESAGTDLLATVRGEDLCLAIACEKGDDSAWIEFESQYRSTMNGAARALTRDDAEAEDLVQYVFGDLFGTRLDGDRRLGKLAHYSGRGSLGGWLRAVVYQCFIDRKRVTARFEQVEEVEEFDRLAGSSAAATQGGISAPPPRPDNIEDRRLRQASEAALLQAMNAVSARDRLLLNYYYFDDLTLREIGEILGVHEATISRWLARAQKDVRKKTEEILQRQFGMRRAEIAECLQLAAHSELDVRGLLREIKGPPVERAP
jgi:RNA polymerase sigma-70 factor, ECF subfamily